MGDATCWGGVCPSDSRDERLEFLVVGIPGYLPVVLPPADLVCEKLGVLCEERAPVPGDVLHPQVLSDELLTPADTRGLNSEESGGWGCKLLTPPNEEPED